jgi:hypothetical protein
VGSAKEEMMRQEELVPMYEWIEENYGDDAGEEDSEAWGEAVEAYENHCEKLHQLYQRRELETDLEWYIYTQSQMGIFETEMGNVTQLLGTKVSGEARSSLLVMLHGHTVASVESYLASTFIHKVTNSESLIRRLVETDPVFSEKQFTLKQIYEKQEGMQLTVADYLKDLIFHNLAKVKPMFRDVLGCEFGDISWLFKAVQIRHHCVHRAGRNKNGEVVEISENSIKDLLRNARNLVHLIECRLDEIEAEENQQSGA